MGARSRDRPHGGSVTLPLDTHAHVDADIDARHLVDLRACVVAVTRGLDEFERTRHRTDASVVWAAGCHPGLARKIKAFARKRMINAVRTTPVIGEVGVDGSSRVPLERQVAVFREILGVASEFPRLVSIHSYRATGRVLTVLREYRPPGAILHWWLGTADETAAAVELGAYFSVNASQASRWTELAVVPADRLLLETDHPFGDRHESPPRRPGNVATLEARMAARLGEEPAALRRRTWRNLRELVERLELVEMFPREFQVQMLAA
jgi:TatD DNase family protein